MRFVIIIKDLGFIVIITKGGDVMKKNLLALSLLGGVVFAQDRPVDPCGSPKEVFSKPLLDQCYRGYFKATTEAKRNADEALRLAREANNKVNELEKRVSSLKRAGDDRAIVEAKRNADEALRLAREANNKVNELEKRVSSLEKAGGDKAIMEAKKNAEEALRLATEANNKIKELEKRLSFYEKPADDKAIVEARKNIDEAVRLAREANNKVNELEKRLSHPEKPADDKAIMEAKKSADEALRLATEANNKIKELENRVSSLEKTADDHERRIRALEGRKPEAPQPKSEGVGPYKWQLEEIGAVYFDFNRFDIKESEARKLDELVNRIRESGREVLVVGFADKRGPSNYNFNLSMWRAQMTASYLAKKGVDIGKIRVAAYGKEVADLLGQDFKDQRVVKIYLIY